MQTSTATMENSVEIPSKTGNRTVIRPRNPTAGHTHRGNQNWKRHEYPNVHRSTVYNRKTWKPPRCPSADERIRKLWYIYTMEYYLAIKKNTFESVLMRWMKLEPIIQSEVSQKEKHQYSMWSEVTQSCPTLSDPMDYSTLGLSVPHHLLEFAQVKFISTVLLTLSNHIILCLSAASSWSWVLIKI